MLLVVCPYVKWMRVFSLRLSNLMAIIPTADDMFDVLTAVEPGILLALDWIQEAFIYP